MENVIEIKDLKMRYDAGGEWVLKGVDLDVAPGQIIGYIGPNGAGKSTTVKIILGMVTQYDGSVHIFGKDIKEDPIQYKSRIGYVPEIANLYDSLTGKEYLNFIGTLYGLEEGVIKDKGEALYRLFGIEDALHSRIVSYSKGMKQKLMIIAALIHDPELLFFDEPINGLDANSVMIFKALLKKLSEQGKTIFYSSHIMEVVEKISDRIVVLNDGVVAADGHFDTLKAEGHVESLQDVFNQLTGFHEHDTIAQSMVDVIVR
ncbi:ABC transporter ATP-binding protein [Fusibacter sp. JL298sf-3]